MLFCVKSPINKLYVFGMALLLAVALAGCGGGGGGGAAQMPDPEPPPMPTPQEQCEDAGGRWNADMTCTSAEDLEAERMAMVAAATKAAGTKEMAIMTEGGQTANAGLGGNAGLGADGVPGGGDDTYSLSISRDRMGTMVKIADSALAGEDDPKFMQAMDLGGGTTMHARAMAADDMGNMVEEVVIVSTDIEAPMAVAFAKFEEDVAGTMSQALDLSTDTTNDAPTATNEALNVTNAVASPNQARLSNIMAAHFSSSGAGTITYAGDNSDTTDMDEALETAGTYNGAMGTYRCNNAASGGGSCTITYDAEGKIVSISADWAFIPAAGAMSDQPDYDYYRYGFWLKKTTDADGAVTYNEVETFAESSLAPSGGTASVLGQATYEGGATGVYVKNVYNSDRTLNMATSGHFTADVSLMATFGQVPVSATDTTGTIAPNLLNTVSGTIDNFMLSGGEEQMWSVAVQGDIADNTGTASGTAKGGVGDGSFSATFHGDVTTVDGVTPQPGSVVGEFNAGFTNGSVAGGFGARKQ